MYELCIYTDCNDARCVSPELTAYEYWFMSKTAAKYRMIAEALTQDIEQGRLAAGDKVPSLRGVCTGHKVSIITAKAAYRLLERNGLLEARPKSGFFVKSSAEVALPSPFPERPNRRPVDQEVRIIEEMCRRSFRGELLPLAAALPGPELLPLATLRRVTSRVLRRDSAAYSRYADPFGVHQLREVIARHYRARGVRCVPDDVVIHGGALDAITTTLRTLTRPGDTIILEKPTYYILFHAAAQLGLKVRTVRHIPGVGIDTRALRKALRERKVRALLLIPNFHNPTGTLTADATKEEIVGMCARAQVLLIEDDVYGDLHFGLSRPSTLLHFDKKDTVVHCSSVSKTLGPGLRVGWSISRYYRDEIERTRLFSQISTPTVTQLIAAEYLYSEGYSKHLRRISAQLSRQGEVYRNALTQALPQGTRISKPQGGFVLWVELPKGADTTTLYRRGIEEHCAFAPGIIFGGGPDAKRFFRISFATPFTSEIENSISRLGSLL